MVGNEFVKAFGFGFCFGDFFFEGGLFLVNFFCVVFDLGFGLAWRERFRLWAPTTQKKMRLDDMGWHSETKPQKRSPDGCGFWGARGGRATCFLGVGFRR